MATVTVKAYAKLNLSLDVKPLSGSFHPIDSVVCSVDVFDTVKVTARKDGLITCIMHGMGSENIPYDDNNAVKAAQAFAKKYATCGVDIVVYKNIPMGAGLGGSSADCAGVLNAMRKLYAVKDLKGIKDIADSLGSDTGYMLSGGFARISGRGDIVRGINSDLRLNFVLFTLESGVNTGECYRRFDAFPPLPEHSSKCENAVASANITALAASISNGLYRPAVSINGDIAVSIAEASGFAPLAVSMTGSGSCVFALVESQEMARYIVSRYNGKAKLICCRSVSGNADFVSVNC